MLNLFTSAKRIKQILRQYRNIKQYRKVLLQLLQKIPWKKHRDKLYESSWANNVTKGLFWQILEQNLLSHHLVLNSQGWRRTERKETTTRNPADKLASGSNAISSKWIFISKIYVKLKNYWNHCFCVTPIPCL